MKKGLTEMVFILDASGSMSNLTDDTIGGFNSMIAKQKKEEGDAIVSLVTFDTSQRVVFNRVPLEEVRKIDEDDYVASGCTALLDAVGKAIDHITDVHNVLGEADTPEKTIFVITTDGMENASLEYSYKQVKNLIQTMQKLFGWEFIFLGANIDAVAEGNKLGIRNDRAVKYYNDQEGVEKNFEAINMAVKECRTTGTIGSAWCKEVEEYAKRKEK